jgi:hypothetical protein
VPEDAEDMEKWPEYIRWRQKSRPKKSRLAGLSILFIWIGVSVVLGFLIYQLLLGMGGPWADCLSDPLAYTPGASLRCRYDPVGIPSFFDRAYRLGWLTVPVASVIVAGFLGLGIGLAATGAIIGVAEKLRRAR